MPVLSQTPVVVYTANGSVTTFNFSFQVLTAGDLEVFVNTFKTTDYSVTGIGNAGGGTVTFTLPPANGSIVRIVRTTAVSRSTDYVEGGVVPAETLDADFDRIIMMIQENKALGIRENAAGAFDLAGRRIVNVAAPVGPNDAATKAYTDALLGNVNELAGYVAAAQSAAAQAAASASAGGGSSSFYINIKAYGAVGDGVHNDTAAIQNAINAAAGRGVFIPEGTYLVDVLNLPSNTFLIGYGATSILKTPNNAPDQTFIVRNADFVNGNTNIRLFNFTLDGNQLNQTLTFNNCCTQFKKVTNLRIENMTVKGGISEGIYIFDSPGAVVANNDILGNGRWQDDGSGIHLESCDSAIINNNRSTANGFHGIILTGVTNSVIATNNCYANGYDGLRMQWACKFNTVTGNSLNGNTRFGLYMGQASDENMFTGNTMSGNDVNGIQFDTASNNYFTGNQIINNSNSGVALADIVDVQTWTANDIRGNLYLDYEDETGMNVVQKNYGETLFKKISAGAALTDAATIAVDGGASGKVFTVTLAGNRTVGAPTNIKQYETYTFRITQDGTGTRTLTWNAAFKFGGAGAPTLTTTAGKTDIVTFIGGAGNTLECVSVRLNAV